MRKATERVKKCWALYTELVRVQAADIPEKIKEKTISAIRAEMEALESEMSTDEVRVYLGELSEL